MGVFDDSDDDSDSGKPQVGRPGLLDLHDEFPSISTASAPPLPANRRHNEEDNKEVDPLDAFMCGVESEAKRDAEDAKRRAEADDASTSDGAAPPKRARLDVDNDEEATSHWTERSESSSAAESSNANQTNRLLPRPLSALKATHTTAYSTKKSIHWPR